MLNRSPLKQELDAILIAWNQRRNPASTIQTITKKREPRWHNLGLAIASLADNYESALMREYIELLTELAQNQKTQISQLLSLLRASSPGNHATLPVILTTQKKDSDSMQYYIQLLQTIAKRHDTTPEEMMQLVCHQYSFEWGAEDNPKLDVSNILVEMTCMLDDKTLREFLQLLIALQSNNMLENHGVARLFKMPNSFPENIGELIANRHKDANLLLLLTEILSKCKQLEPEDYLPTETDSSALLTIINQQSLAERMTNYRHATDIHHPLYYLMRDRQTEVQQCFAIARQEKLLETIEQMPAHDQINACMDALNPETELGAITFAADSPGMIEQLNNIKNHAQEIEVNGSELLVDIFSSRNNGGKVIAFANTGTGLFQPEKLKTIYDEDLGNVIQQGFSASH